MNLISLPPLVVQSLDLEVSGGRINVEGLTSEDKYYGLPSERWVASLRTVPLKEDRRIEFEEFIGGLRGPTNLAQIVDLTKMRAVDKYYPSFGAIEAGAYAPSVGIQAVAGSEFLTISGINEPDGSIFARAGALFSIINAQGTWDMYKLEETATVSGGSAQLTIWPRIRRPHPAGTPIRITDAAVSLRMVSVPTRTPATARDEAVSYVCDFREVRA